MSTLREYEQALERDPTQKEPFLALRKAYRESGTWDKLITLYEMRAQALTDAPKASELFYLAAEIRLDHLDDIEGAEADLAHAIDREAVLNGAFRHNLGPTIHKPLNSPFPAGSWAACGPRLECATVPVPLDWRHPRGPSIDLAAIRRLASRGESLDAMTGGRFDIVGWDPAAPVEVRR